MTGLTAPLSIVEAAARLGAQSFLIDGEVVIISDDGTPDFHALRSRHRGPEAVLYALDLIDHDGADLRDLPLIERKRRLARLSYRGARNASAAKPSDHSAVTSRGNTFPVIDAIQQPF